MMESRQIPTRITTNPDLPARYPGSTDAGITPEFDWWYVQAVHRAIRGGVFLDNGSLKNAEHAKTRLINAGLMEGRDEDD